MSDFSQRRIALIGGAGFIGHHLALRLKSLGAQVFVVDSLAVNNLYSLHREGRKNPNAELYLRVIRERLDLLEDHGIALEVMDARDYNGLCHVLKEFDVDAIVHLAAVAHAGKSNKDPFSTFDHSLRTLENALDNARSTNLRIKHFVYLSSSMVYGNFKTGTVDEDTVCEPLGIYGALKYAGEKIVIAYNQVFNLPYTIIRPSALYGERCISRRVSQIFVENAVQGQPITVSGDGSDRLDFTYVQDLVSGIVNVLENETSKSQTFNLTYGQSRSITDLAGIVGEHFPDLRVVYQPKDNLMPDRGTLSVDRAKRLIGYNPEYPLERGLANYISWYEGLVHADAACAVG
jgi:nucleoside-diphosphate-sugar epimerase